MFGLFPSRLFTLQYTSYSKDLRRMLWKVWPRALPSFFHSIQIFAYWTASRIPCWFSWHQTPWPHVSLPSYLSCPQHLASAKPDNSPSLDAPHIFLIRFCSCGTLCPKSPLTVPLPTLFFAALGPKLKKNNGSGQILNLLGQWITLS